MGETSEPDNSEPEEDLSRQEARDVEKRRAGSTRVVHEVVRLQGEEELKRPALSLLLSALAAGLAINLSLMSELFLRHHLPDSEWAPLVYLLGYPVGYIIVIMGRLQLFTESTVTAVLPVATHPSIANMGRLLRLWSCVLAANLVGVTIVSALMAGEVVLSDEQRLAAIDILGKLEVQEGMKTLTLGIPAGFIMAALAWILPNAKGSEFWVICLLTYVIGLGGFSHVVTGSSQASFLWLSGRITFAEMLTDFTLPALAGNIIGGTGLFAVLAHGQMRSDRNGDDPDSA
ncbi:formate/nitrite transporter family protein [Sphingobium sufflavum]|uniref:formate/nitrite transporter family protein n=1 Tax=Sphingobium sufflavum TaxID=1129547 RepID=UPI001F361436|nr:formate/nitrite transporter family protein [Sphingobium sufflavum]MCE7797256.1 formate/nitrite transporter family protein [Sphingobium sufflavum]